MDDTVEDRRNERDVGSDVVGPARVACPAIGGVTFVRAGRCGLFPMNGATEHVSRTQTRFDGDDPKPVATPLAAPKSINTEISERAGVLMREQPSVYTTLGHALKAAEREIRARPWVG